MTEIQTLGMLNWVHDIPEGSRLIFLNVLEMLRGIPNPNVLEVGTFAGTTITTIANMFPNAICYAIDNWSLDEDELNNCMKQHNGKIITYLDIRTTFLTNTKNKNITLIENDSTIALVDLVNKKQNFDFIYVDGSHTSLDTVLDLTLSWMLLDTGGILAIDDYLYTPPGHTQDTPKQAVDCFLQKFKGQYIILNAGYRIFLQKKI